MTFLTLLGFVALLILALYVSFAAFCIGFSETLFGKPTILTGVTLTVAILLWGAVWWLSPFKIVITTA